MFLSTPKMTMMLKIVQIKNGRIVTESRFTTNAPNNGSVATISGFRRHAAAR